MVRIKTIKAKPGLTASLIIGIILAFASGCSPSGDSGTVISRVSSNGQTVPEIDPDDTNLNSTPKSSDSLAPQIIGIRRYMPAIENVPHDQGSVVFLVRFDEAVSGIDIGDFSISGPVSGLVSNVSLLSSENYLVTISNITNSGELKLTLLDNDSIKDLAGNSLARIGTGSYVSEARFLVAETPTDPPPSTTRIKKFNLILDGSPDSTIQSSSYDSTKNEHRLNLNLGDSQFQTGARFNIEAYLEPRDDVKRVLFTSLGEADRPESAYPYAYQGDNAGDFNPWLPTVKVYSIQVTAFGIDAADVEIELEKTKLVFDVKNNINDISAPEVLSIQRMLPSNQDINETNTEVTYRVTFNEPVSGVQVTDFDFSQLSGDILGVPNRVTKIADQVWTLTVSQISGAGEFRMLLKDNDTIIDSSGNPINGPGVSIFAAGETYRRSLTSVDPLIAATGDAIRALQANCTSCHISGTSTPGKFGDLIVRNADILDVAATNTAFANSNYIKVKDPAGSPIYNRIINNSGNMPLRGSAIPTADNDAIRNWIQLIDTVVTPPPPGPQFTCVDENDTSASSLQRLTSTQYQNTLEQLFGINILSNANVVSKVGQLPQDEQGHNYNFTGTVDSTLVDAYYEIGKSIADLIVSDNTLKSQYFGSCSTASTPTSDCLDQKYLGNLAEKILRRPLTTAEKTESKEVFSVATSPNEGFATVLTRHLVSPYFIVRIEVGSVNDDANVFALTQYEIASRISYSTTDSMPDDALFANAKSGSLSSKSAIEAEVRRLFGTQKGKIKIRQMFRVWLEQIAGVDTSNLASELLVDFQSDGLDQAATDETNKFIDYIVWEKNAGYKELLTSKASLATHPGLATIYGHTPVNANRIAGDPVPNFSGRRQGLLMRTSYLNSPLVRTNLVSRGVRFLRYVMCEDLPDPPTNAVEMREELQPTIEESYFMNTREYITRQTASPVCMSCHSKINPVGFSFENLDPVGRFRDQEKIFDPSNNYLRDIAVDSSSTIPVFGEALAVEDSFDLINHIANSAEGPACFARQAYRFLNQRKEDNSDQCQLQSMYEALTKPNASLLDAFVAGIASKVTGIRKKD